MATVILAAMPIGVINVIIVISIFHYIKHKAFQCLFYLFICLFAQHFVQTVYKATKQFCEVIEIQVIEIRV